MKPQTKSNLIAILFGCVMLLFIWLFHNEKQARKEAESINAKLMSDRFKEFAETKENAILIIKKDSIKIDSLQNIYLASEKKRKTNYQYFQNELKKIKVVNTSDARNRYNDSLTAYLRQLN